MNVTQALTVVQTNPMFAMLFPESMSDGASELGAPDVPTGLDAGLLAGDGCGGNIEMMKVVRNK